MQYYLRLLPSAGHDFTALIRYNLLVDVLTSNIDNFQIAIGLNLRLPQLSKSEFLYPSNQIIWCGNNFLANDIFYLFQKKSESNNFTKHELSSCFLKHCCINRCIIAVCWSLRCEHDESPAEFLRESFQIGTKKARLSIINSSMELFPILKLTL